MLLVLGNFAAVMAAMASTAILFLLSCCPCHCFTFSAAAYCSIRLQRIFVYSQRIQYILKTTTQAITNIDSAGPAAAENFNKSFTTPRHHPEVPVPS
jgi:hypothetical protein